MCVSVPFSSPALIAEHDSLECGISLWQLHQLSWLCHLSTPCAPPVTSLVGGKQVLRLCQPCSAIAKISLCYQHYFGHRSKPQHHKTAVKTINSIPAKTSMNTYVVLSKTGYFSALVSEMKQARSASQCFCNHYLLFICIARVHPPPLAFGLVVPSRGTS